MNCLKFEKMKSLGTSLPRALSFLVCFLSCCNVLHGLVDLVGIQLLLFHLASRCKQLSVLCTCMEVDPSLLSLS